MGVRSIWSGAEFMSGRAEDPCVHLIGSPAGPRWDDEVVAGSIHDSRILYSLQCRILRNIPRRILRNIPCRILRNVLHRILRYVLRRIPRNLLRPILRNLLRHILCSLLRRIFLGSTRCIPRRILLQ